MPELLEILLNTYHFYLLSVKILLVLQNLKKSMKCIISVKLKNIFHCPGDGQMRREKIKYIYILLLGKQNVISDKKGASVKNLLS